MKHKVAELEGALLDEAVWAAQGNRVVLDGPYGREVHAPNGYLVEGSPSTDWSIGGPLIERERIELDVQDRDADRPTWRAYADGVGGFRESGPTPLIAAMRAYVASKLCNEIELP
jgi:hypothetical protein